MASTTPRLDQGADYERGFIDGMQKQMQSSVDKAVNRMAQPEQEPVAWMYVCDGADGLPVLVHTQKDWARASWWHEIPLYTAPPQRTWVGLTEEELCEIVGLSTNDSDWNVFKVQEWLRKVEAKLKEKNNG